MSAVKKSKRSKDENPHTKKKKPPQLLCESLAI